MVGIGILGNMIRNGRCRIKGRGAAGLRLKVWLYCTFLLNLFTNTLLDLSVTLPNSLFHFFFLFTMLGKSHSEVFRFAFRISQWHVLNEICLGISLAYSFSTWVLYCVVSTLNLFYFFSIFVFFLAQTLTKHFENQVTCRLCLYFFIFFFWQKTTPVIK